MHANTPEQWANESLRLAQAAWVQDGTNLDEPYYQQEINVVDRQMALAGLRLAKLLNEMIGKMTPRDFAISSQPSKLAFELMDTVHCSHSGHMADGYGNVGKIANSTISESL